MKYQVRYEATYYVDADNDTDATKLAMFFHEQNPDGHWEAVRDPYASPLSSLADGTYRITEAHSVPVMVFRDTGYWVATGPVQAVSDVPEGEYLGVWTDPDDSQRYYDVTRHIEDLDEAMAVASYYDQKAIWDNANKVAISVN